MWPFNQKKTANILPTEKISYSQLDITENFDDNLKLKLDEQIKTIPLNLNNPAPESVGLPSKNADAETIYKIAFSLSKMRESVNIPEDGVYCAVCHIANTNIAKLHTPCPQCKRDLLKFGWD